MPLYRALYFTGSTARGQTFWAAGNAEARQYVIKHIGTVEVLKRVRRRDGSAARALAQQRLLDAAADPAYNPTSNPRGREDK